MRQIYLAPNKGAVIGSALAQGINGAVQNFMKMRQQRSMMDLNRYRAHASMLQAQAMMDYRKAMGEAALAKTGNTQITPEFIQAARALGVQPQMLGQFMMSQQPQGGAPQSNAPSGPPQSSPGPAAPAGGGAPGAMAAPASPAAPSAPAASPASGPGGTSLSYGQRQLIEKMASAQALAQRGIPGAQASMYGSDQRLQAVREGIASKEQINDLMNQYKTEHDTRMGELQKALQGMKNQGAKDVAGIRGKFGHGAGNTPADKAGLENLKDINRQILESQKVMANPTHGIEGVVLSPEQVDQRRTGAKAQYDSLIQSRDSLYQQYPQLRGAGMSGSGSPAQPSAHAPAGPAGPASGVGPLRIYDASEAHQAPAGALLRHPNGNVYKVIQPNQSGDPVVAPQPIQSSPQSAPIPVAVPGQAPQPMAPPPSAAMPAQPPWAQ